MSDRIVGIAVLDRTVHPPALYCLFQRADGEQNTDDIPVWTDGDPVVRQHQWHYSIVDDTLHVNPSVNWPSWNFHNEGTWSIPFRMFSPDCGYVSARDYFRHLNGLDVVLVPQPPPP